MREQKKKVPGDVEGRNSEEELLLQSFFEEELGFLRRK
jgi:hypothetical protein